MMLQCLLQQIKISKPISITTTIHCGITFGRNVLYSWGYQPTYNHVKKLRWRGHEPSLLDEVLLMHFPPNWTAVKDSILVWIRTQNRPQDLSRDQI